MVEKMAVVFCLDYKKKENGWSRQQASQYLMLTDKVAPQVLVLVREHQKGRGAKNAPSGAFDFTEGWFRNRR